MTRIYQQYQRRISFLSVVVIIVWGGLGFQLFNIQVANGEKYHKKGQKQSQIKEILPALRGNIFDKNGIPLTRNIIHYTIAADPSQVQNKLDIAKELSKLTGKPVNDYIKKLGGKNNFAYLERNLQKKYAQPIIEKNFKGIIIQRHSRRTYPQDNIVGQLVGFTNVDDEGLAGIEQIYNKQLSGNDGWIIKQRSGMGDVKVKNNYPKLEPTDGADIQLTINIKYQSVLQEELLKQIKKTAAVSATGIVINPQTGAILAISSVPDFNPNHPNKSATENQKIRAFTDQFEPGSTFKIVAATAAIDNNLVGIEEKFDCENGTYQYKSVTINDHLPHNDLSLGEIIEKSSNIGIIKVASRVGEKSLYKYAQKYGFGTSTNIGLNTEASGTLRELTDWSKISLAEISMGHEIAITVLQLAMAYSAVSNGGILLKPYIINNINNIDGVSIYSEKSTVIRKIANENVMNQLSQHLTKVVKTGTGIEADIPGWQVAGKTGTAQKFIDGAYSHTKFVSNFVGYLPASNPQLLCVITLDEPKLGYHWGAIGAAPVFKRVMERIINLDDSIQMPKKFIKDSSNREPILVEKKFKKSNKTFKNKPILLSSFANEPKSVSISKKQQENKTKIVVPNVRGMSLKKAINTLHNSGFESKFAGSGIVVWQSPKPGAVLTIGTICSIGLE
ncbi:MAG: penicillin-binding protein [Candidatus Neomarinimicrobiota bacterium]